MKKVLFTAALSAAALAGLGSFGLRAQDLTRLRKSGRQAGVFGKWLRPDAPECVPISEIGSVSRLTKLTPEQFQFVRALYIAIPPVSAATPAGRQRGGGESPTARR